MARKQAKNMKTKENNQTIKDQKGNKNIKIQKRENFENLLEMKNQLSFLQ